MMRNLVAGALLSALLALVLQAVPGVAATLSEPDRQAIEAAMTAAEAKAPRLNQLRIALSSITRSEDAAPIEQIGTVIKTGFADLATRLQGGYEKLRGCTERLDLSLPTPGWIKKYRADTQKELAALEAMIRDKEKQEREQAAREVGVKKDIYLSRAQSINAVLVNSYLPTKNEIMGGLETFADSVDSIYSAVEVCRIKFSPLFEEQPRGAPRTARPPLEPVEDDQSETMLGSFTRGATHFLLNNVAKNVVLISLVAWSWRTPPLGIAATLALGWYWFYL